MKIFMIYGQGGVATSWGLKTTLGAQLTKLGHDVSYWGWSNPQLIVDAAKGYRGKLGIIGYSLGANAVTWACGGWLGYRGIPGTVDLAVGYDPTINSFLTPIGNNVKKAICFHQTSMLWPTSLFFGRAQWTGKGVEVYNFSQDHLAVQFNQSLHDITIKAVEDATRYHNQG